MATLTIVTSQKPKVLFSRHRLGRGVDRLVVVVVAARHLYQQSVKEDKVLFLEENVYTKL